MSAHDVGWADREIKGGQISGAQLDEHRRKVVVGIDQRCLLEQRPGAFEKSWIDRWAARKYPRKREDAEWCAYEGVARDMKRGLWAQAPSEWIDPNEWHYRKKRQYKYTEYSHETTADCVAAIGKK
jgi:hypothetical protein